MNEAQKYEAKWKQLDTKECIQYDPQMKSSVKQHCTDRKQNGRQEQQGGEGDDCKKACLYHNCGAW